MSTRSDRGPKANYLILIFYFNFFFHKTQPLTFLWMKEEAMQSLDAHLSTVCECINEQTNKLSY